MFKIFILFLTVLGISSFAYADFTVPEQVNDSTSGLQANRDGDTPWGIAVDDSGNVHFVFESQHPIPGGNGLDIHYRVLDYVNLVWGDEESVTADETFPSNPYYQNYGHPSIVFDEYTIALISYCKDMTAPYALEAEMRTRVFGFYGSPQFGAFDFMSNENIQGGKYSYGYAGAKAIKTPVMAIDDNGVIYGFWLYPDTVSETVYKHIYFNENVNFSWGIEEQHEIYNDYNTYSAYSICSLADPNGDIHLVMGLKLTPSDASIEVYHCWYDVSDSVWSDLEIVSEVSQPDGNNSTLPYLAFRKISTGYKMYAVWEDYIQSTSDKQVRIRIYDSVSESWNTEVLIEDDDAEKPCVAVQTNGDIYVVWQDFIDSVDWIYYKWYDYSNSTWSTIQPVTDNEDLNWLHVPTIICDKWDNLHLSGLGEVAALPDSDFCEVFYSYWDAPPHIWDLTFLQNQSNQDSVVIDWEGMNEPDLDTYKVYRKFENGQWQHIGSTTDTRYADTTALYFIICRDDDITKYYVEAVDDASQSTYTDTLEIWCIESGKIYAGNMDELIGLQNNYPNPFNARTTIEYTVPFDMQITLEIYDILGRKVETLIDEFQSPGSYAVNWDASHVASGMYFYRFQAGDYTVTKRMTIIK